jgi:hypothetical protein
MIAIARFSQSALGLRNRARIPPFGPVLEIVVKLSPLKPSPSDLNFSSTSAAAHSLGSLPLASSSSSQEKYRASAAPSRM